MYYSNLDQFKGSNGYEIEGVWYPRVTKIIEIKAKPALYRFYAEMNNFNAGEAVKNQSAAEGTLMHETIERILVGQSPVIDPTIAPAVEAFLRLKESKNIQVDEQFVEKQIVHFEERYAGTLDALALIGGKFGVLDIKTSQAIYRDYDLQTAAYMAAIQNEHKKWTLNQCSIKFHGYRDMGMSLNDIWKDPQISGDVTDDMVPATPETQPKILHAQKYKN